jgi:hypothetical protein
MHGAMVPLRGCLILPDRRVGPSALATVSIVEERPAGDVGVECLMLPVGVEFGAGRSSDEPTWLVRRGARVHDLDEAEHAVWVLAHGSTLAVANRTTWRRSNVVALAEASGVSDAAQIVADLLVAGLLVEVVPESDDARAFAMQHRLVPLMLGLGNSLEEPSLFNIGFFGQPVLEVDYATYDLWQWSAMDGPLWHTCVGSADVARRSNAREPNYLEPDKLLTGLLREMHRLLFVRAACLDVDFQLAHPGPRPVSGRPKW